MSAIWSQAQFTTSQRTWLDTYITKPLKADITWLKLQKKIDSATLVFLKNKVAWLEIRHRADSIRINTLTTKINDFNTTTDLLVSITSRLNSELSILGLWKDPAEKRISTLEADIAWLRSRKVKVYFDSTKLIKFPVGLYSANDSTIILRN